MTHTCCFGLQLVEAHAILQDPYERVRVDVARKGQGLGVAYPASGQLQGGIAKARLLQVSPDCARC